MARCEACDRSIGEERYSDGTLRVISFKKPDSRFTLLRGGKGHITSPETPLPAFCSAATIEEPDRKKPGCRIRQLQSQLPGQ